MSIYKDCDIRGIYGEDLREEEMGRIGRAVAGLLQGRTIVVGGDFRTHTPSLKAAFVEALLEGGAKVWDVGQVSTPQLYFSKRFLDAYGSAQITASHNPPKYNGLKLMLGELPVLPEDIREIQDRAESGKFESGEGTFHWVDTGSAYEKMLRSQYGQGKGVPIHVVIDAGNGAMSETAPRVMEALGLRVTRLYCSYDGTFPNRDPNPAVQKNLSALCLKVKEVQADFGVAFDGDGDRAIFVDSAGVPLLAEEAMVIFSDSLVRPGESVVYDLKCSSILQKAVLDAGGVAIMERSGHAFIRRHFLQAGSRLAGEVSGHYFFRELEGDDGLFALVTMADILRKSGRTLRGLLEQVRYTAITPDIRRAAPADEIDRIFRRMEDWAGEPGLKAVRIDGIRLEFPDGSWVLLRRSITEPAFTMRLEAPKEERLAKLLETAGQKLGVDLSSY